MRGLVRIRLARFGRRHQPLYNIVVIRSEKARDKKPIEVIGTYNPIPVPLSPVEIAKGVKPYKDIKLDFDKTKYWLGVGLQPTPPVVRLLKKAGLLNPEWPSPLIGAKIPVGKVESPRRDLAPGEN